MYFPVVSAADLELARYHQKHSPHHLIRQRMHYLLLRARGLRPGRCAAVLDIHPNTATHWAKCYIAEGLSGRLHYAPYRPVSALVEHRQQLSDAFEHQPPRSTAEAAERIEQLTGLGRRGLTQTRQFMKQGLGLKWRRLRALPGGKLSLPELVERQQTFVSHTLSPLLARAASGEINLYFMDAAHPVQGFHTAQVWSRQPREVRTASGRHRLNILGALDCQRQELYSITTSDYVCATTVVELLDFLDQERSQERPAAERPLYIVLDNARYQRCALV